MSLADLGRFQEATQHEREAIRIAEATKHAHTIGWAHLTASRLHLLKGDWAMARDVLERWVNLPTTDVAILLPWAVASLAWAHAQIGDASKALSRLREAQKHLARQEAEGIFIHRGWSYYAVSRACLLLDLIEEARHLANRSIDSSRDQPGFVAHARYLLGDLASHPDHFEPESAATHYQAALTLAESCGMRPLIAHCHLGLGRPQGRSGNSEQARLHLTIAKNMYSVMAMEFWLRQVDIG